MNCCLARFWGIWIFLRDFQIRKEDKSVITFNLIRKIFEILYARALCSGYRHVFAKKKKKKSKELIIIELASLLISMMPCYIYCASNCIFTEEILYCV